MPIQACVDLLNETNISLYTHKIGHIKIYEIAQQDLNHHGQRDQFLPHTLHLGKAHVCHVCSHVLLVERKRMRFMEDLVLPHMLTPSAQTHKKSTCRPYLLTFFVWSKESVCVVWRILASHPKCCVQYPAMSVSCLFQHSPAAIAFYKCSRRCSCVSKFPWLCVIP